jgi:hypothetical protein
MLNQQVHIYAKRQKTMKLESVSVINVNCIDLLFPSVCF